MAIYTTAIGKLLNALHALSNFKEDLKAELMKSISKCDGDIQCISNTIFPFLQINVQDQIKAAVRSIYYEAKYLEKPQGYHPIHIFLLQYTYFYLCLLNYSLNSIKKILY